ncbi:glycosyl transferase family 1 [Hydrogenispora ethanolica]|jgi:hypothetical protein|uniref:Glycosyl transferase family 1 n=1 Tax=Hydrogenispora ethanolica TaxID=1082276 RepID=A0A4R1R495_HYDET|nr:glycosyltransferase [Hydrogenispora ethanolica]TCL60284.1 glycosyl transferase family 1 [Hydrogenispora ethanolica]
MKRNILIVHPFTPYEPGRFFEDALRAIGFQYTLCDHGVDFNFINQNLYDAVLFIESPWKAPNPVLNIQKVRIPKFYWIVHGESRLDFNIQKSREYQINVMLLSNSYHLAPRYGGILCYPLPMAVDLRYFAPYHRPLIKRSFDISFVGSFGPATFYAERNRLLKLIQTHFPNLRLKFSQGLYLDQLGSVYGNSKIVFNWNYMNIMTARPFEAMAGGALLLTNYANGIEYLGQNRLHYVIYRNDQDIINKINFYLTNPSKLLKVCTHGYQMIQSGHTYIHRAREFERILSKHVR